MQIASQHRNDPWRPLLAWPEDCRVQWGGAGIVLRDAEQGGSYGTAFFEAFPAGDTGGFIRGEGATVEEAEASAHAKWRKADACDHRFGRRGYTNSGGLCTKCRHFACVFRPIVKLGDWKRPIEIEEISFALGGYLCPFPDEAEKRDVFKRRLLLRLRAAGMELPDPVVRTKVFGGPEVEEWVGTARKEIRRWLEEGDRMAVVADDGSDRGILEGLLRSMDRRRLEGLLAEPRPD